MSSTNDKVFRAIANVTGAKPKTKPATDPDPRSAMTADEFNAAVLATGYSLRAAARELEVSYRMFQYYSAGTNPVPKVVAIALRSLKKAP